MTEEFDRSYCRWLNLLNVDNDGQEIYSEVTAFVSRDLIKRLDKKPYSELFLELQQLCKEQKLDLADPSARLKLMGTLPEILAARDVLLKELLRIQDQGHQNESGPSAGTRGSKRAARSAPPSSQVLPSVEVILDDIKREPDTEKVILLNENFEPQWPSMLRRRRGKRGRGMKRQLPAEISILHKAEKVRRERMPAPVSELLNLEPPVWHQCSTCKYKSRTASSLTKHNELMHKSGVEDQEAFKCEHCNYTSLRQDRIGRHIRTVHVNERPYSCELCSRRFKRNDALKQHLITHYPLLPVDQRLDIYHCHICSKVYRSGTALREHMSVHSSVRNVLCEECGATFKTRATCRSHVNNIHARPRRFACDNCGRRFNTKFILQRHKERNRCQGVTSSIHLDSSELMDDELNQVSKFVEMTLVNAEGEDGREGFIRGDVCSVSHIKREPECSDFDSITVVECEVITSDV